MAERSVRLRYGADLRQRFRLAALPKAELEERKRRLRLMSKRLVAAGKHAEALKALTVGAAAKTQDAFAEVERAVDELVGSGPVRTREPKTFRDVALLWTSGDLHRRYPDRVAAKITAKQDRARAAVLCETIGDVQLRRFTIDTAERALAKLPRKLARGTRRQYAQIVGRVLRLAVFPLRVIEHSPLPIGWVPSGTTQRAFTFLYPAEETRLMRCERIELELRLLYGFLAREGLRISEALRLTWSDLDLTLGVIRLDRNKTRKPRAWKLATDVCRALQLWGALSRRGQGATVFHASIIKISIGAARQFRADLQLAGIERPELYERSAERSPIRVHDLRATFITLSLAAGKSETWVMDRTGHTTSNMVNGYRRQARHAAELELGWLGPLDELLGLGRAPRKTTGKPSKPRALQRTTSSNERPPLRRKTAKTAEPETPSAHSRPTGPAGSEHPGHTVELALAEALRAATAAGEWAVVAELARELGERRRERTTTDTPSLEPARVKRHQRQR